MKQNCLRKLRSSLAFAIYTCGATIILLTPLAGCFPETAKTEVIHTVGFPDLRRTLDEGRPPWAGTFRCFRSSDGQLFYFNLLFNDEPDYSRYCTELLETNGITKFKIKELGRMSYEQPGKQNGFQPEPDRIDANFEVEEKATGTVKHVGVIYMLPEASRALGRAPDFRKLGQNEKIDSCVKSVANDMKGLAQELVRKLKDA